MDCICYNNRKEKPGYNSRWGKSKEKNGGIKDNIKMNLLCYADRKSHYVSRGDNAKSKHNSYSLKDQKQYRIHTEIISSPKFNSKGNPLIMECSYILCEKSIESGKERNVICNKKVFSFCGDNCWQDWLSSGCDINNYAVQSPEASPYLHADSPEYLEYFKNLNHIGNIPSLFI